MSAGWFLLAISLVAAAQSAPGGGAGFGAQHGKEYFFNPNGFKVFHHLVEKNILIFVLIFKDGSSQCTDGQENAVWQLVETNLQYKTELTGEENSVSKPIHSS